MRKARQDSINSKQYIMEAVTLLIEKQDIEDITVTDICKKAGVARVTFYKYYTSIYDVMNASVEKELNSFIRHLSGKDQREHLTLELFTQLMTYKLSERRLPLERLVNSNALSILLDYFTYAVQSLSASNMLFHNQLDRGSVLFAAGGMFNMVVEWIRDGFQEPVETLAERMARVIPKDMLRADEET
ncbi:TetR/AcrR family transcriptional regulator [uncultured Marinococcus sp.]|uniref:TetR/AcrR family transcriptional regulator n=1 Tax=uncultured Marinococcus sp. TaxID=487012 RepID=UPI002609277F|nr:TetR/AcrR family transcriptional regulator [uncultured Marinococcus sp.]